MKASNIFVVGTGHCGTTTFAAACQFATNMTAAHESAANRIYDFQYPENHIEVDAPLAFRLPLLRDLYPGCRFVHLIRDRQPCIASMARNEADVCQWFGRMLYHYPACTPTEGAAVYYDIVNRIVTGPDVLRVYLETVKSQWQEAWDWMGCEGDFTRSREEWNVRHHASD